MRLALPGDEAKIASLYHHIYQGTYPDPLLSNVSALHEVLKNSLDLWVIAIDEKGFIGACLNYRVDSAHRLAKVSGAVVHPDFRGQNLTQRLMHFGLEELQNRGNPVQVIYATVRTVTAAPQKLTESLGFRRLGIFPNTHKTQDWETHGLVAFFGEDALKHRFEDFRLHWQIARLYSIVQSETGLEDLKPARPEEIERRAKNRSAPLPDLEIIDAPGFVRYRFEALKTDGKLPVSFFPFHLPNLLITSADQKVEVFLSLQKSDQHCVIVGIHKPSEIYHGELYTRVCQILRDRGVRYIETLVRADKLLTINETLKARFIPCAYFPGFQLHPNGHRLDFIVLSRTFEPLDFSNMELSGTNLEYLKQYYHSWKEISLNPRILGMEDHV